MAKAEQDLAHAYSISCHAALKTSKEKAVSLFIVMMSALVVYEITVSCS